MDNVYGYDAVSNILSLANNSPVPVPSLMGGPTTATYQYDDLYRLTQAQGLWTSSNAKERYSLALAYDSIHNLTTKTQTHDRQPGGSTGWLPQKKTSYNWAYAYASGKPHAASQIGERAFSYDGNGNQTGWDNLTNGQRRTIVWDEENRIHTLADNGATQYYTYDGDGERAIKRGRQGETLYLNAYTVVRNGSTFSKHYFIESQRLVTKLGDMVGTAMLGNQPETAPVAGATANAGTVPDYGAKTNASTQALNQSLAALGIDATAFIAGKSGKTPPGQVNGTENNGNGNTTTGNVPGGGEQFLYYYHGDHLGSTGYVTDASGEVYQHIEYFPFGETWIEEHSNTNRTPYQYTGKELDEETGLYYYGARYYDPRTSVWQSPDPILDKYLGTDPSQLTNGGVFNSRNLGLYSYGYNNPVNLLDPDGRSVWTKAGKVIWNVYDKGSAAEAFADNVKDFATMVNPAAPKAARFEAFLSLASEALPVSAGDLKDAKRAYNALEKRIDAAGVAKKAATYERPSGYRKGVRDDVWNSSIEPSTGRVRDSKTGRFMGKEQPWDMGHKPGYEFKKHQRSAAERGIDREQFLNEHNDPTHYRPELPSSNRGHSTEDKTDAYFGY